ncbi:hypothetical protein H0E87_027627 [Populus deltoides]|uniref:Uncharacterized protein n=1 Tax=Populus deltoides TaxID=3696 RepID=A0A8T2WNR2_POPDE|nr:hypothetical protein H0E87_027627 [Populus deltoides]
MFKTGYLTLSSPRSMFVSQLIGTAMGCMISPCVFWLFFKAFRDLGTPGSQYPAPYATVFRNMAILGVEGFSSLPKNCLYLCYWFFGAAILINLIKDALGKKRASFIPNPMAMAIPFYIGSYFAIDMCVGSLILFIWEKIDKAKADAFGPAVASGLICGDGIWTLPSSILALAGVKPPIRLKFLSRRTNAKFEEDSGTDASNNVQTENIKSECANITGCRHVAFEHIAIIFVDFFFLIRIRPSRTTPKTAVVILGCCFPAFNSSAVVLLFDVITTFAPVCIIFGFYSIW